MNQTVRRIAPKVAKGSLKTTANAEYSTHMTTTNALTRIKLKRWNAPPGLVKLWWGRTYYIWNSITTFSYNLWTSGAPTFLRSILDNDLYYVKKLTRLNSWWRSSRWGYSATRAVLHTFSTHLRREKLFFEALFVHVNFTKLLPHLRLFLNPHKPKNKDI